MKNPGLRDFSKFQSKLFGRRRGAQHWLRPFSAICPFFRLHDLSGRSMRGAITVHLPPGLSEASMKSAIMIGLPPGLLRRKGASLVCPPPGLSGEKSKRRAIMIPRSPFLLQERSEYSHCCLASSFPTDGWGVSAVSHVHALSGLACCLLCFR